MSAEVFQQKILSWFDLHGRKTLPWQRSLTPYSVWLSEIMLQQTQVVTVIPYFNRFVQQFPDIKQLAKADQDHVLHAWSGLGYYARARNLHKTAQIIVNDLAGVFPDNLEQLMALPGIGRSTAGAILSIAFNQSQPILDGNVKRVLSRFQGISGWTSDSRVSRELWTISRHYTPVERCADYTQAIMDLGATVCTRHQPDCKRCPLSEQCEAQLNQQTHLLPTPKPRKKLPIKAVFFLLLCDEQGQVLLEKRPESGLWGGLWSFPEFDTLATLKAWCQSQCFILLTTHLLELQRHTFTHYHLDYTGVVVYIKNPRNNVMEAGQSVWYNVHSHQQRGIPTPVKRLLQNPLLSTLRESNNANCQLY